MRHGPSQLLPTSVRDEGPLGCLTRSGPQVPARHGVGLKTRDDCLGGNCTGGLFYMMTVETGEQE